MYDNVFISTKSVIKDLKKHIDTEGVKYKTGRVNGKETNLYCHEVTGLSFTVHDFDDIRDTLLLNGLNPLFAEKDFLDRVGPPTNPGKAIAFDTTGVLKGSLDKHGRLSYTYSERLFYQLPIVIAALRNDPHTRQAFLSVFDPQLDSIELENGYGRIPCSIGYHFLYRKEKLRMVYTMRSLNILDCLGYDMYTSAALLAWVARQVDMAPGPITFNVGSAHYFSKEEPNVKLA